MNTFFGDPDLHPGFIAANRSRAVAAGVDPYAYDRATTAMTHIDRWPDVFGAVGEQHLRAAEKAIDAGRAATASDHFRAAALWHHFATVLPDPDTARRDRAARTAADALRRSLSEPFRDVTVDDPAEGSTGLLRGPADAPVVVLIPGMNSAAVEFTGIADTLLRRGLAVLAIDGPGQGPTPGRWTTAYERVVTRAIDALPVHPPSIGVWAMSMGGYLGVRAHAAERRIAATVAVSGPARLDWDQFVPYVSDTFVQRTGGVNEARAFAASFDASTLLPVIDRPLRIVEGGLDQIPGVTPLAVLAEAVISDRVELLTVPDGNHLVEEHRDEWLPATADWLAERLTC